MKIYDVFIAGCGIAGAAAALFAGKRGLSVYQAGSTAEIIFASGLIDVFDAADPWQAMAELPVTDPRHPYALVSQESARAGLDAFLAHLKERGLPYRNGDRASCKVLTPMGALKSTWAVPESMWAGVDAAATKAPTLLIDFEGLREFSATQIAAVAGAEWPGLKTLRLDFPAPLPHPLLPGNMAQALEFPDHLEALADLIRPHLRDTAYVGLPAILGNTLPARVHPRLQELLGLPVFEIPTLPASVPGMRLKSVLESGMANVTPPPPPDPRPVRQTARIAICDQPRQPGHRGHHYRPPGHSGHRTFHRARPACRTDRHPRIRYGSARGPTRRSS